jgi:SAM-dependent methyltransferase
MHSDRYYDEMAHKALTSAQLIWPTLKAWFHPRSVVDVGCGRGAWLRVAREDQCDRVLGIDIKVSHPTDFLTNREYYRQADFREPFATALGTFDLAISLEVAEHLPESKAQHFIQELTRLSEVVVFSAAIPGQGGLGHINEQWPVYWASLFQQARFKCFDILRGQIWADVRIPIYYRQNIVLFVQEDAVAKYPALQVMNAPSGLTPLSIVHPETFRLLLQSKSSNPG